MASSLVLTGGAASARTLKESISQTAHGFTVGDVLRWNTATNTYVKAQGDTAVNAEVVGVVNAREDANSFQLTYSGYIEVPAVSGASYPVLFLSGSTAGELSATPPSFIGSVVKPVLTRSTNGSGHIVVNYLGTQIGGSSTVAIDEIQPVGTIAPYAGGTIPDTWLECNGASYAVSDYAELHDKIRNTTGDRVPIYGYVARLNIASTSNITVGGYIQFKTSGAAWSTNTLYGSNADITAVVITSEGSSNYLVQVLPNYANSKFVFPNTVFAAGSLSNAAAATANYRFLNSTGTITTSITATVSGIAVIAFNTPDLRGRFAVGVNPAAVADGTSESDTAYNSALSAFALGEEGGSESIGSLVNVATWNATSAEPSVPSGSAALKPPYLATKYIIKAKPYTRAAIVDGLDIPYSSLLVRDLRSRNVGGSNGDLVLHTNTAGDGGLGTERMRLTTDGKVGIGTIVPQSLFDVTTESNGFAHFGRVLNVGTWTGIGFGYKDTDNNNSANYRKAALVFERTDTTEGFNDARGKVHILNRGGNNSAGSATLSHACLTINHTGDVGIGNTSPGATLDVNGTLKVGNFGGSTNVMVKPTLSSGVGQIVPLWHYSGGQPTVLLPAGTWFITINGQMNGNATGSAVDENTVLVGAFTVTVPSGQHFALATYQDNSTARSGSSGTDRSGLIYRFFNDTTAAETLVTSSTSVPSNWTEFTESASAPFKAKRITSGTISGFAKSTPDVGGGHSVIYHVDSSIHWVVAIQGYAIRIA